MIQESGKIWHLADANGNVVASAQRTVTSVIGQSSRVFNGSTKIVYLSLTFPHVGRGLYLYSDDEGNPMRGENPLP